MLILSNEDIEKILPVGACLEVLEEAYRDLGNGMAATVPRYDVFSPTKPGEFYEYKTMSGVLPARNIAALRLNSSVVKWYEKAGGIRKDKLPVAGGDKFVGLVMLFSTETGEPLAIFPDGYVQKLRVAGASAIAARYLARKDATVMALLGTGWQASAHLVTLSMVRDLRQVRVHSPTPESRRRFVENWSGKVAAQLIECASANEAIETADMVTCTTNSISPLFDGEILSPGVHIACVKPCELDAAILFAPVGREVLERTLRVLLLAGDLAAALAHPDTNAPLIGVRPVTGVPDHPAAYPRQPVWRPCGEWLANLGTRHLVSCHVGPLRSPKLRGLFRAR